MENKNNRIIIEDLIKATRLHLLNTALSITSNKDEAIKIVENTYVRFLSGEQKSEDVFDSLNKIIHDEASKYLNENIKLKDIENINDEFKLQEINIEQYKEFYDNPKVEAIIHETINSLPSIEKEIVIQTYFLNYDIKEVANKYNVSVETINNYLNKANNLINDKAGELFKKNKTLNINYNAISIVYSVIKLGIGIATFDVLGISIDAIKGLIETSSNKEKEDADIKSLSKDVVEDMVQDWCLERISSYTIVTASATSVAATGAKVAAASTATVKATAATKLAGAVLLKKAIIFTAITAVTATGGYVAYEVITEEKPQEIIEKQQQESKQVITATVEYINNQGNCKIEIFSSDNINIDYVNINFNLDINHYESMNLGALEAASKILSGITFDKVITDDQAKVTIYVIKDKVDNNVVSLIRKYVTEDYGTINDIVAILELDKDSLYNYLCNNGYKVTKND